MEILRLTPGTAEFLVGKTIKWQAPIYKGNKGHFGYGKAGGIAIILKVDVNERKPIIEAEIVEGDDIRFAFNEWTTPNTKASEKSMNEILCFSDGDRYISCEEI